MIDHQLKEPGLIVLFGSGETSPTGRKLFDAILRTLPHSPKLALLETPAGFELNSSQVIGRIGEFFERRLQNYAPRVEIIQARKRGSDLSPDNPRIVEPILHAQLIFMGPGSPSYAIRQLRDSLAWQYLVARHRLGAVLALASAATVALSAMALPVYEIYKAGEDIHWIEGLDFFKLYGLQLVFVPHWNNNDGGSELDTSRCFMGRERFAALMQMLPDDVTIIGLDEKTALIMDPSNSECRVKGLGNVTLLHTGHQHSQNRPFTLDGQNTAGGDDEELFMITKLHNGHDHQYKDGDIFSMSEIGPFHAFHPEASLPPAVWQEALRANEVLEGEQVETLPREVMLLIQSREQARQSQDWKCADELRKQIENLGWNVRDTTSGPIGSKRR